MAIVSTGLYNPLPPSTPDEIERARQEQQREREEIQRQVDLQQMLDEENAQREAEEVGRMLSDEGKVLQPQPSAVLGEFSDGVYSVCWLDDDRLAIGCGYHDPVICIWRWELGSNGI